MNAPAGGRGALRRVRGCFADPLVQVSLVALLVFVAHDAGAPDESRGRVIVIPRALSKHVSTGRGAAIGPAEPRAEDGELLERWKTEEVMYREALRLGLDRNDSTIRKHLIAKTRKKLEDEAAALEPTQAEPKAWLNDQRASHLEPERHSFEHQGKSSDRALERILLEYVFVDAAPGPTG